MTQASIHRMDHLNLLKKLNKNSPVLCTGFQSSSPCLSLQFRLHNNLCLLEAGAMCWGSTRRGCSELVWVVRPQHITPVWSPFVLWLMVFPAPLCFGFLFSKACIGCVFRWLIPVNIVFGLRGFLGLVINHCSLRDLASVEILPNKKQAL